jgi:hypothetical protein
MARVPQPEVVFHQESGTLVYIKQVLFLFYSKNMRVPVAVLGNMVEVAQVLTREFTPKEGAQQLITERKKGIG